MLKIINFEDNVIKHWEIKRVLEDHRIPELEWVKSVEEGLEKIEEAKKTGNPFDLIISDMHYPLTKKGDDDVCAGEKLMEMLWEREIEIPVIICSALNYTIREAYACVWYSEHTNWEWDLGKLIDQMVKQK